MKHFIIVIVNSLLVCVLVVSIVWTVAMQFRLFMWT